MGYKVKESKILFLDSRAGHQENHKSRINFPTESFSAKGNELIRLTLLEFNMKRTFYNINSTNNKFFILNSSTNTPIEVEIPQGNYGSGTVLASTIQSNSNIATCTFDTKTERLTITLESSLGAASYLFSKKIKGTEDYYDTHEILGGLPTTESGTSNIVNMFGLTSLTQVSRYPIQLQTINNILLKTNLQTSNFQNRLRLPDNDVASVVNSQIFASIPVPELSSAKNIKFIDSNNTFEMYLQTKHINNITFDVETVYGDTLPALDEQQYSSGNLHYNIVIKYEILQPEIPTQMLGQFKGDYSTVINR
jgi:hypothetical protein